MADEYDSDDEIINEEADEEQEEQEEEEQETASDLDEDTITSPAKKALAIAEKLRLK